MADPNIESCLTAVEADNETLQAIVLDALQISAQNASAIL